MKKQISKRVLVSILAIALLITSFTIPTSQKTMAGTLATTSDYTVTANDTSNSVCKLTFNSKNYASYVIVHYKVNNQEQQNVSMSSSNGYEYSYDVTGLKTGDIVSCSFTYNKGGLQYDSTLMSYKTGSASATNAAIQAPFGLVVSSPANNTIGVVWGRGDINSYNVYIDGNKVGSNVECGYYTYSGITDGMHTVAVTTLSGSNESLQTTATVNVSGDTVQVPTTQEPTTQKPTTTTPAPTTQKPTTTTTSSGVDSSIAKPFGMVVGCPTNNTISVVWGRGDIDSYNVYIDGKKVASKVGCAYYTYSGYVAGTHTVSLTTVDGSKESEKTTMTVTVTGASTVQTTAEATTTKVQTTTVNNGDYEIPETRADIKPRDDKMYLQLNNKTNGKYSDDKVYWCILGRNKQHKLCYLDSQGNLVEGSTSLNTVTKGDRKCANICHSLAEKDYVYLPDIESGRMYLSYGSPVYITFNIDGDGNVGYAGPDLNNTSDPNQDVLFEFLEFTVTNKEYWGNTTRVDFFSFPTVTRLIGNGGFNNYPGDSDVYDKTVGDIGTREEIFAAFKNEVPLEYKTLLNDQRIMAPCKSTFNEGEVYANYFDNYINEFWNKYSTQDLVFKCDAGTFTGRVSGDRMTFTKSGQSGTYTVYKPTTQDVLEGKGNFNRGNSTELVIEAQLCAALNRGIATDPANYGNPSAFYKNSASNFYSGFWHKHSINGLAYGFCYDDVFDQSTLLHYTNPTGLIIDLKW